MTLIDNQDRNKLCEGRNVGIGYAFCKREGDTYTTVQPLSPCKEFLNEVVYAEVTGKQASAYGLTSKKEGIFSDGSAYMVLGILPHKGGTKGPDNDLLESALMSPETGLKPFLSHFEAKMGINPTTMAQIASNRILATLDGFWVTNLYRISLWSLLVRVGLKYKSGDPFDFFGKVSDGDGYMVKSVAPKLKRLMDGERPEEDLSKISYPHPCGIVAFNFPPK